MRKPVFIILTVLIIMTAAVYFVAYGSGQKTNTSEPVFRGRTFSTTTESTPTKTPVDLNSKTDYDFNDFIPEVDFATLLFAFENPDGSGKTFLYTNADLGASEAYVKKLVAGGYAIISNNSSKKNDSLSSKLYNPLGNVTVFVEYENTGLKVEVLLGEM